MEFVIDNTTLLLLGVLAFVAVYLRFFSHPTPLVHPLLLGKQSDVSAVRRKGESGVYRSFATGQGSPVSCLLLVAYRAHRVVHCSTFKLSTNGS